MQNSYRRVTVTALLAALVALAGCEVAVSQQQGGPNLNGSPPEPSTPLPEPTPANDDEASWIGDLIG